MSAEPLQPVDERLDPKRVLFAALGGLGTQIGCLILTLILANVSGSLSLQVLSAHAGVGVLIWLLTWVHLKLLRAADEETQLVRETDRRRRQRGVDALFEDDEQGMAVRNLTYMERFVAPGASALVSLLLAAPVAILAIRIYAAGSFYDALTDIQALDGENLLVTMAFAGSAAFGALLMGSYAGGLSRSPRASRLRAGAGYLLTSAIFLGLSSLATGLASKGWLADWPDRVVGALVIVWMTLQSIEVMSNFILDFYRPRVAGVESRPAYDSRLSGLFAEPQGIFRTFAHTMDYQFGFSVSETWFFRFLEKAFAPLLLVQLATLYLLTCFVVVEPGEVAIIQRWGAPRGITTLPADDAGWDALPTPAEPGLHVKWPWPIETVRLVRRDRVETLPVGYKIFDEDDAAAKADEIAGKTKSWDAEHIENEYNYLMPLPEGMMETARAEESETTEADVTLAEGRLPDNALYLSGLFTVEYRIGDQPGDVYRYAYNFMRDRKTDSAAQALRAIFERELTAYLAGAQFWDVMISSETDAPGELRKRLQRACRKHGLGLLVVGVYFENVHPPVGDVGSAFQEVLQARQGRQGAIYDGEIKAKKIIGLTPSQRNSILSQAEAEKYRKAVVAKARAKRFAHQLAAFEAAPQVYPMRLRLQAIEDAVANSPLVVHPPGIEIRIDRSKQPSIEELQFQKGVLKQEENVDR